MLDFHYGDGREVRMVANPIRFDGVALPQCAAPAMGEHDDALLREADFDDAAIARLRDSGAIAGRPVAPAHAELDTGHAA